MTKQKRKPPKALTTKSLGLVDDVKLSALYANTRTNFKIVSDVIIGYYVAGDGLRTRVRIAPIYRAEIWLRGKAHQILTSHEIGAYYNPPRDPLVEPDEAGDTLAYLASTAIGALQRHAAVMTAKRPAARKRKA